MSDISDKMTKLQILKVMTANHIPPYLIEHIKHRDFDPSQFLSNLDSLMRIDEITLNPHVHVFVVADEKFHVVGFFWFTIDPFTWNAILENFVMDPEYWGQGKSIQLLIDYLKPLQKKLNIKKFYFNTRYPQVFEKYGFKRSKDILMEYKDGQSNGKHKSQANNHSKPSAAAIPECDIPEPECNESDQPGHAAADAGELQSAIC